MKQLKRDFSEADNPSNGWRAPDSEMTEVLNMATGEWQTFSLPPRQAVIAAHAQSLRDWNTWDYAKRYDRLVQETEKFVTCGDFSAEKD